MKRFLLLGLAVVLAGSLQGCLKWETTATVANDATMTMEMEVGYKPEALEMIRAQIESSAEMLGEEGGEQMDEALDELDKIDEWFEEEKLKTKMKEYGIEVTKVTPSEDEDWKSVKMSGKVKDINAWLDTMANQMKKQLAEAEESGDVPFSLDGFSKMSPRFYKTDKQDVGELVIMPSLTKLFEGMGEMNPLEALEQLDDMDEAELEQAQGMMEMMKGMFGLDEMSMVMTVKLPGKVLTQKGCTKVGENGLKFSMTGNDLTMANVKTLFGLKDGISATFQIPEGCKIKFLDKEAASESDSKSQDGDSKKKKGGLQVDDEDGK